MIGIVLSEIDFDYELQALVRSFFPGQECRIYLMGEEMPALAVSMEIFLGREEILGRVMAGDYASEERISESFSEDWHKKPNKAAHPCRARFKNLLKHMVFQLFAGIPEESIPPGCRRVIPAWGTMTGVRPAKIPLKELLQGKTQEQVREELERWYCCQPDKLDLCMEIAEREAKLIRDVDLSQGYSLYIGIPFCPTTCLYCSFPSYPYDRFGKLSEAYLQALFQELEAVQEECADHPLSTVYVGGGTPTALTAEQLECLLSFVEEHFPVEGIREWTVEAGRPDSITEEKLRALSRHGVSRISINPQTMQEQTLRYIGRKHSVEDVKCAFYLAREMGFDNINMDLIAGLPGEDMVQFEDTLAQIRKLNPDSITVHSLVVKRASRLRESLEQEGDDRRQEEAHQAVMNRMIQRALSFVREQGYVPYYIYRQKNSGGYAGASGQENIGFARPGKESLYNILMMEETQTIAAAGAGASTKYYHVPERIVSRGENVKSITDYISRIDEMIARKRGKFWEKR